MKCVGVTGLFASGKTTAAKILSKQLHGRAFSLSDEVRVEAGKRGLTPTVENLRMLANELRERRGPGVWAERVISRAERCGREWVVVESVRSPAEVMVLKKFFGNGFFLVAVGAPAQVRFNRFRRTPRGKEFSSLVAFKAAEEKQLRGGGRSQAILGAMGLAGFRVVNSGSRKDLERKVRRLALALKRAAAA